MNFHHTIDQVWGRKTPKDWKEFEIWPRARSSSTREGTSRNLSGESPTYWSEFVDHSNAFQSAQLRT